MDNSFRFEVVENHHDDVVDLSKRPQVRRNEVKAAGHTYPVVDIGAAWYHDEAIAEAREAHAHPYR